LQTSSHAAIEDILVAFPDKTSIADDNLHTFVQAYQARAHVLLR